MTPLFETNLAFLEKHSPLTLAEISRESICEVHLLETEKGLTLQVGQTLLHDPDQIENELVRQALPAKHNVHIVFGLGLGYVLHHPPHRGAVVIWEPEPNVAKVWVETADVAQQLATGFVHLTCDYARFHFLAQYYVAHHGNYNLVVHSGHVEAFPAAYAQFQECLRSLRQDLTFKWRSRIGPFLLRSSYASLPYYAASAGIETWRNTFADKPAVIVAAGPSLEKNLHHLVAMQDRVVVFALARTAKPLIKHGIRPHFLVQVEAQDYVHLIEGLEEALKDTVFLLADQTHPAFYEFAQGRTLVYRGKHNPVTNCLEKAYPQRRHEVIKTGGSVATAAFYLAHFLGCNPLILIGQDLAVEQDRWYAFDTFQHDAKAHMRVKGYYGGQVTTLSSYAQNIFWYQKAVAAMKQQQPERRIINATEGGAYLEGMEHIPFASALESCADQTTVTLTPLPTVSAFSTQPLTDQIQAALCEWQAWVQAVEDQVAACEVRLSEGASLQDPHPLTQRFHQLISDYPLAAPLLKAEAAALSSSLDACDDPVILWSLLGVVGKNVKSLVQHLYIV